MRRSARSLLAVAVGFAGATAVFQAAGVDPMDGIVQVGNVDEDDMAGHCRDIHGPASIAFRWGTGANSWQCSTRENRIFLLVEIDFDLICTNKFGDSVRAYNPDPDDPYAWECIKA